MFGYLSGLDTSVICDDITTFLKTVKQEQYLREKVQSRYANYNSFKVGVPFDEELLNPEL